MGSDPRVTALLLDWMKTMNNTVKTVQSAYASYKAKVAASPNPASLAGESDGFQKELDAANAQAVSKQIPFPDWDALRKKIDAASAKVGTKPPATPPPKPFVPPTKPV